MPKSFMWCLKQKRHRVRTKKLKGKKYIHICWLGKKSYSGEVKEKK